MKSERLLCRLQELQDALAVFDLVKGGRRGAMEVPVNVSKLLQALTGTRLVAM